MPTDEEDLQLFFIERAKTLRYFDKRLFLMNYANASLDFEPTFLDIGGETVFPVVDKLGKAGHNDVYNKVYRSSYMSGEKESFAINAFDGIGSKGFAVAIPDATNYQFPDRRTELVASSNSDTYSYNGAATAANKTATVTKTFEVFDLVDAVTKSDVCSFRNIMEDNNDVLVDLTKADASVLDDCGTDPADAGGEETGVTTKWRAPYNPFTPTSGTDTRIDGHNYRVNTRVKYDASAGNTNEASYNPKGFAPNYYAKGLAIAGVGDLPSWVKAFSVVKKESAGRVVCQGIGMYGLRQKEGLSSNAGKDTKELWFHSPDIESGIVSQDTLDDIAANPGNYKLQFESPLGFFSEVYNHNNESGTDVTVDLVTYARA